MSVLIAGFLKVRQELIRESNLYRCLENMSRFCDTMVVCDDASTDGTRQVLQDYFAKQRYPLDQLLLVDAKDQDFRKELSVKAAMLDVIHRIRPKWIWWQDGDEELEVEGAGQIRALCSEPSNMFDAFRFHYVQLWRKASWHRIDDGFDDGRFVKLWRWRPELAFDVREGTHHCQFPGPMRSIHEVSWKVVHWGNYGKNLQWKIAQYRNGLGGVERHRDFEGAVYKQAPALTLAVLQTQHAERKAERVIDPVVTKLPNVNVVVNGQATALLSQLPEPNYVAFSSEMPKPYTQREKIVLERLHDMKGLADTFTVVIPTFNRAEWLSPALQSLLDQTYTRWIAVVIDNGSTDNTPEVMRHWQDVDPRIFYIRLPNKGAVAANEVGMDLACEWSSWWTRLGSDDYFEPNKLFHDAIALKSYPWVYGCYRVLRKSDNGQWEQAELCNLPEAPSLQKQRLLRGEFCASWANMAVRTTLLKDVKAKYGNYCDPRLVNMEDLLFNSRAARFAEPVWRGRVNGGNGSSRIEVNPTVPIVQHEIDHDAYWRVNPIGASADTITTGNEDVLTRQLITEETCF